MPLGETSKWLYPTRQIFRVLVLLSSRVSLGIFPSVLMQSAAVGSGRWLVGEPAIAALRLWSRINHTWLTHRHSLGWHHSSWLVGITLIRLSLSRNRCGHHRTGIAGAVTSVALRKAACCERPHHRRENKTHRPNSGHEKSPGPIGPMYHLSLVLQNERQ